MNRLRLLLMSILCAASFTATADQQPNFIIVLTDDQRADAAGYADNDVIITPGIDAFAKQGLRFTEAHAVLSLCSPSRAAILTGKYGRANGVDRLGGKLRDGQQTFASLLKKQGYQTAVVGKWHLKNKPADLGFDFACTFEGNGAYYKRPVNNNGKKLRPEEHVDAYCVSQSIAYLEKVAKADKPFVLFHNSQTPHMDGKLIWDALPETLAKYKTNQMPLAPSWDETLDDTKPDYLKTVRNRRVAQERYGYDKPENIRKHTTEYYAVITELDRELARLFQSVERLGLSENTYLIFLSDNGWMLGEHGMTSKVLAYNHSTRIPLAITGPGIQPGETDAIALNIDIAPTLLELAGVAIPDTVQGKSMAGVLKQGNDATAPRDVFVYECLGGYGGSMPMLAAIDHNWKLIHTYEDEDARKLSFVELYDLKNDPDELNNLAGNKQYEAQVDRLEAVIKGHIKQHVRGLPSADGK